MKVYYDKDTDSAYIELSSEKPENVVELSEGVNLDTTSDNKIVGIWWVCDRVRELEGGSVS